MYYQELSEHVWMGGLGSFNISFILVVVVFDSRLIIWLVQEGKILKSRDYLLVKQTVYDEKESSLLGIEENEDDLEEKVWLVQA